MEPEGKYDMNANCNKQDLHEKIATSGRAARGTEMAVVGPTTLRRPHSNGPEKTPTGPPPPPPGRRKETILSNSHRKTMWERNHR